MAGAAPSPFAFFQALGGYQATAALKAAIELELFTRVGEGQRTVATLANAVSASPRGVRILADYLTVLGFLTKSGVGDGAEYGLTPDSAAFLDRRSHTYVGDCVQFLTGASIMRAFEDLAGTVRRGHTALPGEGSMEPDLAIWVDFARGMMPMMFPAAQAIAELLAPSLGGDRVSILDIAAGHGIFGILLAQRVKAARVLAVDWQAVLQVARENALRFGVADRYDVRAGSAFDVDLGSGHDVALVTNFLHHFDPPTNETLLRRVHAALAPGGRAAILEFVPNDDRVTPPMQAGFALTMLGTTREGDAYTHREIDAMCKSAGFARTEIHPAGPAPQSIVVATK
jgi:SAM-dependent methyltransferase